MKNTVSFETAKRLAESGFPQPEIERGQTWFSEESEYLFLGKYEDCDDLPGSIFFIETTMPEILLEGSSEDFEGMVFAPTATDILEEIYEIETGWSLRMISEGWIMERPHSDKGERFHALKMHTNPAEACAAAWLKIKQK